MPQWRWLDGYHNSVLICDRMGDAVRAVGPRAAAGGGRRAARARGRVRALRGRAARRRPAALALRRAGAARAARRRRQYRSLPTKH